MSRKFDATIHCHCSLLSLPSIAPSNSCTCHSWYHYEVIYPRHETPLVISSLLIIPSNPQLALFLRYVCLTPKAVCSSFCVAVRNVGRDRETLSCPTLYTSSFWSTLFGPSLPLVNRFKLFHRNRLFCRPTTFGLLFFILSSSLDKPTIMNCRVLS